MNSGSYNTGVSLSGANQRAPNVAAYPGPLFARVARVDTEGLKRSWSVVRNGPDGAPEPPTPPSGSCPACIVGVRRGNPD